MELISFLKDVKGLSDPSTEEWPQMLDETLHVRDLDLPEGSLVLVRGDIDSKKIDEEKLNSQKETLEHCIAKGWRVILCGHRNRPTQADQQAFHEGGDVDPLFLFDPDIRGYLETLIGKSFSYVRNWLRPDASALTQDFHDAIDELKNGEVLMLENERLWDVLWSALWDAEDEASLSALVPTYRALGKSLAEAGVVAQINDAASDAKNVNFSTVAVLPFMKKCALGFHFKEDLGKIKEARKAKLVCFSGAKLDKIKKMRKIVKRGYIETIITGGLVCLPLIAAEAKRKGQKVSLGAVAEPGQKERNRELYISPELIAEAEEIYKMIDEKGLKVRILNPVDMKLDDGSACESHLIPEGRSGWDVGPKSMEAIRQVVDEYIVAHKDEAVDYPVFLNGFLGRKEVEGFEAGTQSWGKDVGRLADAGFKVIAGGGEGRQVYAGAEVIISGGTTIQGMGTGDIPALKATWLLNRSA